jgi:hypothetical protein
MDVQQNRDFISTEVFKKNRTIHHYDSFIFGSSRTLGFQTREWKKYLEPDASPFVFEASGETLYGIYSKIKYLDEQKVPIRNALLIICRDATFEKRSARSAQDGHIFLKHPDVAKTSWFMYYLEFIKSYFDRNFITSYYAYKITHRYYPFMKNYIETRKVVYDPITNDVTIPDLEAEISSNPDLYYQRYGYRFRPRSDAGQESPSLISREQETMLREIREIFRKQKTRYRIVISPLYEQKKLNDRDLDLLRTIFDARNVFDFSGRNDITNDVTNYYEHSHFRPKVGNKIYAISYSDHANNAP